jgi:hypothetical protein
MSVNSQTKLTVDELVRSEIAGKIVALGRYDEIIWKIRTGYVLILYGTLGLLLGKGQKLDRLNLQILVLICGFSVLAYFVDLTLRIRQLRVVTAVNLLTDQALMLAMGESIRTDELRDLLHIAGESRKGLHLAALVKAASLIFLYYAATPAFAAIIYLRWPVAN